MALEARPEDEREFDVLRAAFGGELRTRTVSVRMGQLLCEELTMRMIVRRVWLRSNWTGVIE